MVSTVTVKRALAALATRTDTARRPYAAVIEEGDAARKDLRRAAGFVDAVGLDRLEEAVAAAERDGRESLAERGREALTAYRRFRTVATDGSVDGRSTERGSTENASMENASTGNASTGMPPHSDYFHRGLGTTKADNGQGTNR